jgi:cytoskeletal protein CcmA (bactofilin family)
MMFIVNIYEVKRITIGLQCDIFGNILGQKRVVLWDARPG